MKLDRLKVRRWMMVLVTLGIFGVFVARLLNVQIVQADEIRKRLEVGSTSKQTVKATRGEIVDRNGVPMVSNELGYDVIIDKVSFPSSRRNEIILELIQLFEENGAEWNDNLPITRSAPFRFQNGYDSEVTRLKNHLEIQPYTSAEDTMYRLIERYKLEEYSAADARKIAGVRYEMEQRGFEINVPYTFAKDIRIDLVLRIKERSYQLDGVDIQESALRTYEMGDIAPHLIGRVGPIYQEEWEGEDGYREKGYSYDDIVGKTGVELALEDLLRGRDGERVISLDANGRVISAVETNPPQPGNTIVLTIDSKLQALAQKALEAQIKNLQNTALPGKGKEANYGAVVVLNNKTGEVLAAATYPSFDQNTYRQDYAQLASDPGLPLYNRALQGLYAPGSTFKPVVGTAALSRGTYADGESVFCGMVYTRFSDYQPRCLSAHGNISLTSALSVSCNIFFYDVGWNVGIESIDQTAKQYGLGEPTGIELVERTGQRSNPENFESIRGESWSNGNVLQSAIGQLVAQYTPLQLAGYAATIANRGERMKLTMVKEVRDYAQNEVVQPFRPQVADRVDAKPEDFEAVIRGMVAASRTGSARAHFASYPFDVASKTGTPEAEMLNSTFICFGPAQDPELAIAVVIENGYHGYTSAPVARAIMDEYFNLPNPNPLVPKETPDSEDGGSAAEAGGETAALTGPTGSSETPTVAGSTVPTEDAPEEAVGQTAETTAETEPTDPVG